MKPTAALRFILPVLSLFFALPAFAASVTFQVVATFDYPGATSTFASAINNNGDAAGSYVDSSGAVRGLVRVANGRLIGPIIDTDETIQYTLVDGINDSKTTCGYYISMGQDHSFLLTNKIFTEITTSAQETTVNAVNNAGNVCGITSHPDAAFVTIDGTTTLFQIPGSSYNLAGGINNLDQCVGYYVVGTSLEAGFRRDPDGTLTYPIAVPGANTTSLGGINDSGSMVGAITDAAGGHAVFFPPSGKSTLYDYPGATNTSFSGINNHGLICGSYTDATGTHALIVRARPATGQ